MPDHYQITAADTDQAATSGRMAGDHRRGHGSSLTDQPIPHQSWSLLVTPGHSWSLLVTPGHSWSLLVTPGHSWSFLVLEGRTPELRVVRGQSARPPA